VRSTNGKAGAAITPITRRLFLALGAAVLGFLNGREGRAAIEPNRFDLTPVFLDSDIQLLDTLKNYLSQTAGQDVVSIKRRTYQEITLMLLSGEIDAAYICGFPFVHYQAQ